MKPHPRIRKTIKWEGAAVTVLLVVVWIGSGWVYVTRGGATGSASIEVRAGAFTYFYDAGQLAYARRRVPNYVLKSPTVAWGTNGYRVCPNWLPRWEMGKEITSIEVPLWVFTAAALLFTAVAWFLDILARRRSLTHCPNCNYDRAGIAGDAKCPECGALPVVASR
jgi:hypothetical protein